MMQRHGTRHFISYLITTLLYVGVAVIFFYSKNHHYVSSEVMEEKTIQMSLSTFVPEIIEPPKEIVKEVVESVPEEEPKVEEIIEEPLPEPIVEKVVETPIVKKPKPVIKKHIEKPKKKKKEKKKKITKKKKPKKKPSRQQASSKQSKSTKAERNKFWTKLRVKIDRNKFYPRIAKKRGMQGSVKVKFTILANGNVGHISVSGPKVFHNSAKNAVKKAFPIDIKKSPISLPTSVNVPLNYQLR
jgi:protein TonB